MSKLGDMLQEEVMGEINAILAEAESRAAKLVREAEEKALARIKSHQKKMEAEARAATWRARSTAELTVSTARLQAKGLAIDSVRKKALMSLEEVANRHNYQDILKALAEEALKAVDGGGEVIIHPDDEEKIHNWAAEKGLELRTDPGLRMGVRIVNRDSKRSVENSLLVRLDRAWSVLAPDVAQQLWG
jgi:V/A-type H+-transporting ATPase subunit E